jgi:hypothetical protein|tara:strand:+ start:684 stop:935 length:252 start_codon:yes stop_codon:yes gene_type:complete
MMKKLLKDILCLITVVVAVHPFVIGILNKMGTLSTGIRKCLPWLPWSHQEYFIPVGSVIILILFIIGIKTKPTERKDTPCGRQ